MKISSNYVYINEKFIYAVLELVGGKIKSISYNYDSNVDIAYENKKIIPGFIDIHTHGYNGINANELDEIKFTEWKKYLCSEGVTSFLLSSSSHDKNMIFKSYDIFNNCQDFSYSNCLGINVEGPFISLKYKGAQSARNLIKPTKENVQEFIDKSNNKIKLITIAPEEVLDNTIEYLVSKGIRVSIGHTNADYKTTIDAIHKGASSFTHTFNAMTGLTHRDAGAVGACLDSESTYAELICDGIHVNKTAARVLATAKAKDKLILVTDAVDTKGLNPGIYKRSGREVIVSEDGSCRLLEGNLAGSTLKYNDGLRIAIEDFKIDEITAFNATAKNQAEFLELKNKGQIKENYDADLTIIDDNYTVISTFVNGKIVFEYELRGC